MCAYLYVCTDVCVVCIYVCVCTMYICVESTFIHMFVFLCVQGAPHMPPVPGPKQPTGPHRSISGEWKVKAKQGKKILGAAFGIAHIFTVKLLTQARIPQQGEAPPSAAPHPWGSPDWGFLCTGCLVAGRSKKGRRVPWGIQLTAAPGDFSGEGPSKFVIHLPPPPPPP